MLNFNILNIHIPAGTQFNRREINFYLHGLYSIEKKMKKQAIWNGQVIAESDDLVNIEGNYYFPKDSINQAFFEESDTHTICPWKGTASYYSLRVNDAINQDSVWYYADPKPAAKAIANRVAFWKGVEVIDA